jgi:helicase
MVDLPPKLHKRVQEALDIWGIKDLYPPQKEAFPLIAQGKNLVVCVPTASGKSLIAYVAMLNQVLRGHKALYIVPLRALASEKYEDLKALSPMGVKVALSYGDYDTDDDRLERFDIVVATSEKADSLLRNRTNWLSKLQVIVADEVHLLNDPGRGPTLEVILTRFRHLNPDCQLICLSATVGNSDEVAGWLDAKLVNSDFRPVKLKEGTLEGSLITNSDMATRSIAAETGDPVVDLILDTSKAEGGQVLIFVNTRKSCETSAANAAETVGGIVTASERDLLNDVIMKLGKGESRMLKKLRTALQGGCAFHHAGLSNEQRTLVERAFKMKIVKALFATPTLAAGINLPARRVVVRDWTRYESFNPRSPIPVLEVKQMMGRAGRPKYDKEGEALILARDAGEAMELMERYIWGKPEDIHSKLGSLPALRMHLLSSFATNYVRDRDEMWDFIRSTFYAYQNDTWKLSGDVEDTVMFLKDEGFVKIDDDNVEATDLGKRVARLYIDPLSAVVLKKALYSEKGKYTPFSVLQVIASTTDVPSIYLRAKESASIIEFASKHGSELLMDIPKDPVELEFFLSSVKTAMFFMEWIGENEAGKEASEERMEELFNMGPGDIRSRVETAVWMLYAMRELSRLFDSGHSSYIDMVSLRVENGIREELLPLVKIKGIGRVRARRLFEAGYRSMDALNKATVEEIARLDGFGKTLAFAVKNAISSDTEVSEKKEDEKPPQTSLQDFG